MTTNDALPKSIVIAAALISFAWIATTAIENRPKRVVVEKPQPTIPDVGDWGDLA